MSGTNSGNSGYEAPVLRTGRASDDAQRPNTPDSGLGGGFQEEHRQRSNAFSKTTSQGARRPQEEFSHLAPPAPGEGRMPIKPGDEAGFDHLVRIGKYALRGPNDISFVTQIAALNEGKDGLNRDYADALTKYAADKKIPNTLSAIYAHIAPEDKEPPLDQVVKDRIQASIRTMLEAGAKRDPSEAVNLQHKAAFEAAAKAAEQKLRDEGYSKPQDAYESPDHDPRSVVDGHVYNTAFPHLKRGAVDAAKSIQHYLPKNVPSHVSVPPRSEEKIRAIQEANKAQK